LSHKLPKPAAVGRRLLMLISMFYDSHFQSLFHAKAADGERLERPGRQLPLFDACRLPTCKSAR
jgi:hypothetical protein